MRIQKVLVSVVAFLLILVSFINAQLIGPQTPLKAVREGNLIVVKLSDGDSLFVKLIQVAQSYSIQSGIILSNVGMLRDFSIGQFNPSSKRYVGKNYKLPYELVSMQGNITYGLDATGLRLYCQATLADSTNTAISGNLTKGIVSISNELVIMKLTEVSIFRQYNPDIGYWELDVSMPQ